jgi:hypothetical protein
VAWEELTPEEQAWHCEARFASLTDAEVGDEIGQELEAAIAALPTSEQQEVAWIEAELAALQGQATPAEGQRAPVYGLKELSPAVGGSTNGDYSQ